MYILGIDQSTQGTKALIFDATGKLIYRTDKAHAQHVDTQGWVEHDPMEIYRNTLTVVAQAVEESGIEKSQLKAVGISNQRETAMVWDRETGEPVYNAIVWQCARGKDICQGLQGHSDAIQQTTGLPLSPYFSAAKLSWIYQNVAGLDGKYLCAGTMDSWLVYCLTEQKVFASDCSNASRTQLMNLKTLSWDERVCKLFNIPVGDLPTIQDSNGNFGSTTFGGYLDEAIPIHAVLGDSHAALFGQGCVEPGMVKSTYGTGSSVMMHIGSSPVASKQVVTSLAWSFDGVPSYVLEGNINYTGAVIRWLQEDMHLIESAKEVEDWTAKANPQDTTVLIPAFSGLGAPHWNSEAKALLWGMSRTTGKAEVIKAAVDSIAYQITDVLKAMEMAANMTIEQLRCDGGPTRNRYLMQFQSDLSGIPLTVPHAEELSGIGAAYVAGIAIGSYQQEALFAQMQTSLFTPKMNAVDVDVLYARWQQALSKII